SWSLAHLTRLLLQNEESLAHSTSGGQAPARFGRAGRRRGILSPLLGTHLAWQACYVGSSQPRLSGTNDSMRPVGHLQLADDVGNIVAHRVWTKDETGGDLRIFGTLCQQVKYLALALA